MDQGCCRKKGSAADERNTNSKTGRGKRGRGDTYKESVRESEKEVIERKRNGDTAEEESKKREGESRASVDTDTVVSRSQPQHSQPEIPKRNGRNQKLEFCARSRSAQAA